MSTEPLTCPKCQKPSMVEMKTPDHVALDFCENCNGLWFDQSELADYLGLSKDLTHFDAVKDQAKPTGLQCPKCPSSLVEMPFSTLSDLLIDYCPACAGTYFDFREAGQAQTIAADLESSSDRLRIIKQRFFQKGFGT
ncbi:MAG: zf-TFIIB domain-containing protein [Chromatiales bacterium]|jgi:Zn-finger nucleic acid-binding protein|nr:zf-TFIIB domain-containing protein [Chromatiales bacterium]